MTLTRSTGQPITIKDQIGKGGEGAVFKTEQPTLVAKIYNTPPNSERIEKLRAMVSGQSPELLKLACWPVDLLHDQSFNVKGFLMPNASEFKEIHKLYSPKSRSSEFQSVCWKFLIRAATNMSKAFAAVHHGGHVIGDVNHSSVMIAQDATVKLIDCDSFQIMTAGKRFSCVVAEPMHTAPELQGQPLAKLTRTANHDSFGLAVLIFELLFMGRHPYAGKYFGSGDLSLEQKIGRYLFAYGNNAKGRQVEPPPNTLSLNDLPPPVVVAFERAFTQPGSLGGRPTAAEWVGLLEQLEKPLRQCPRNSGHWYHPVSSSCPWCPIEAQAGISLFNVSFAATGQPGNFNLAQVWSSIDRIQAPPTTTFPPTTLLQSNPPTEQVKAIAQRKHNLQIIAAAVGLCTIGASFLIPTFVCLGVIFGAILWAVIANVGTSKAIETKRSLEAQLYQTRGFYETLYNQWCATASRETFDRAKADLVAKKNQLQGLTAVRQKELEKLQSSLREKQLERYLDKYRIDQAKIPNIGPGRCTQLRCFGIETAADITAHRVFNVSGFGDMLTQSLLDWKRSKENQFRFNPAVGIDPKDIAALDQRIATIRIGLENDLRSGASNLQQLALRIQHAQSMQIGPITDAARHIAQLQGDLSAL